MIHIFRVLVPGIILAWLLMGCGENNADSDNTVREKELTELKSRLFDRASKNYELPIYADPPTADYEDFKKGIFPFQVDSAEIERIERYRNELEPLISQYIDSGYAWIYLAAFLKYESAVPRVRDKLLKCDKFYGWEGPDYSKIESYLNDDIQYCYQMAYISSIEYITSKPLSKAVVLTEQEYKELKEKAGKCVEVNSDEIVSFCSARWLLRKLKRE